MDRDELTKKLLESTPENWPASMQALRMKREPLPDKVRLSVQAHLTRAIEEKKTSISNVKPFRSRKTFFAVTGFTAAAALIAVWFNFISTGTDQFEDLQGGVVTQVKGDVSILSREGKLNKISSNVLYTRMAFLLPGDLLSTEAESSADIQFTSGLMARIGPATSMKVEKSMILSTKEYINISLELTTGSIFLRSEKLGPGSRITISTPTAIASVRGTEFLAINEEGRTRISVQSGSLLMSDRGGNHSLIVEAQNTAEATDEGELSFRPIDENEKRALSEMSVNIPNISDDNMKIIQKLIREIPENKILLQRAVDEQLRLNSPSQKPQKAIDEKLRFGSEEEIQQHYGSLQEVILKDGRRYRGYVQENDGIVSIHTQFGVIRAPKTEVESVQ